MKLQTTIITEPTIERDVYTRPEFRQVKIDIEALALNVWLQITGFEKKEEISSFVGFARRGRSCIQQVYKRKGIKLEIKTDSKKLIVEVCKTAIPPQEKAIPTEDTNPASEYPDETTVVPVDPTTGLESGPVASN